MCGQRRDRNQQKINGHPNTYIPNYCSHGSQLQYCLVIPLNLDYIHISMYPYLESIYFSLFSILQIWQDLLQMLIDLYGYPINIPNIFIFIFITQWYYVFKIWIVDLYIFARSDIGYLDTCLRGQLNILSFVRV